MKTNNNASNWINQAFSFISLPKQIIIDGIDTSYRYHTFWASLLAKMTMCNLTMSKKLTMSQDWIAQQIGCCDRTVRRHLNRLIELGFLKKRNRGFKQTNEYTINPIAKTENFLKLLAPHFHEVALYLKRQAQEKAYRAANEIKQQAILAKQAIGAVMQKGVRLFNSPSRNYNLYNNLTVPSSVSVNNNDKNSKDFITGPLKRVIEALNLTIAGGITFAGYTDDVLTLALKEFRKQRGQIKRPYYWFSSICASLRKQYNRPYDWQKVKDLQKEHNVDDTSPKRTLDIKLSAPATQNKPAVQHYGHANQQQRQEFFSGLLNAIKHK